MTKGNFITLNTKKENVLKKHCTQVTYLKLSDETIKKKKKLLRKEADIMQHHNSNLEQLEEIITATPNTTMKRNLKKRKQLNTNQRKPVLFTRVRQI